MVSRGKRYELAMEAVGLVMPAIEALLETRAKRKHLCIVILDPTIKLWEQSRRKRRELILYVCSFGPVKEWEHPYDKIAESKAKQTWREGRANIITNMLGAANLLPGDTVYWGGFEYYGVVVAASGIQPWLDMLISAWVATAFQHLVQDELQLYRAQHSEEDFFPE